MVGGVLGFRTMLWNPSLLFPLETKHVPKRVFEKGNTFSSNTNAKLFGMFSFPFLSFLVEQRIQGKQVVFSQVNKNK
jgi:hypothetical protein